MEYKEFSLKDLFEVCSSNRIFNANNVEILSGPGNGLYPYVVRKAGENGIRGYIKASEEDANPGNTISFGCDTFTMFYQKVPYTTGNRIKVLVPKTSQFNEKNALYIITAFKKALVGYSWGMGCDSKLIESLKGVLPSSDGKTPDYAYMQERIAELEQERIAELENYLMVTGLDDYELTEEDKEILSHFDKSLPYYDANDQETETVKWRNFTYNQFFKLLKVQDKRSKSEVSSDGYTPLLTSQSMNNGIVGKIKRSAEFKISEDIPFYVVFGDHTLTMNIIEQDFCVADNVKVLKPLHDNIRVMQYICCTWQKSIPTKGYARHWSVAQNTEIRVPVTPEGEPDYDYMERYIRAIEKLCIKNVVEYKDKVIAETKRLVA